MSDLYTRFDQVFFERTRLSILTLVEQRQAISFTALKETLSISDGALYSHLEKLIQAHYVEREKQLTGDTVQTVYSLSDLGGRKFREYLKFLQRVVEQKRSGADES